VDSAALSKKDRFLAMEHMKRVSVMVQAATTRPGPHVHGREDSSGSRFWALETESDSSDVDSDASINTPDFVRRAQEVGFTIPQMLNAKKELDVFWHSANSIFAECSRLCTRQISGHSAYVGFPVVHYRFLIHY